MQKMKFKEVRGDLFRPETYAKGVKTDEIVFAHCIASDFGMYGGIAVSFIDKFDMKRKLKQWSIEQRTPQYKAVYHAGKSMPIDVEHPSLVGTAIKIDNVYNLITKSATFQRPTMDSLHRSLLSMKSQMVKNQDKFLAIPDMIGCGIDGLHREEVIAIIQSVFLFQNDITIYAVKLAAA